MLALAYTLYRVIHLGWRVEWWRQGHGRPLKYGREAAMDIAAATIFVGLFLLDRITRNRPIGLLGALAFFAWWLVLVVWIWVGYHIGAILRTIRGRRGGGPTTLHGGRGGGPSAAR